MGEINVLEASQSLANCAANFLVNSSTRTLADIVPPELVHRLADLEQACSPKLLQTQTLPRGRKEPEIPVHTSLQNLKAKIEDSKNRLLNRNYFHKRRKNQLYFYRYIFPGITAKDNLNFSLANVPALTVQVFRGNNCFLLPPNFPRLKSVQSSPSYFSSNTVEQEFVVLTSQFLTNLRDVIRCPRDWEIPGDQSSSPTFDPSQNRTNDIYTSGMFYLGSTFYDDCRSHFSVKYSESVVEWAKRRPRVCPWRDRLAGSGQRRMESTRFADTDLQLGFPYVYLHQGNCQHILIFTDIRLLTCHDEAEITKYPLRVAKGRRAKMACQCCKLTWARWVVTDHPQCPHDPSYLCQSCYSLFCFDDDGNKLGDFKSYFYAESDFIL